MITRRRTGQAIAERYPSAPGYDDIRRACKTISVRGQPQREGFD
jgi:hypothetical protein